MEDTFDEGVIEKDMDRRAERFLKKYRPYINLLETKSIIRKFRSVTSFDVYALGTMLESWDRLLEMCEADGSVSDLGILPRVAHDIITISFGTSPISIVATVQPMKVCRLAA